MPEKVYGITDIAALLNLTNQRVHQLVAEGILPEPVERRYDYLGCNHAYIEYLRKLIRGNGDLSLTEERTRLTKYQAEMARLELGETEGELLPAGEVLKAWQDIIGNARQRILGISTRLAPDVQGKSLAEIKSIIDNSLREVLIDLANPPQISRRKNSPRSLKKFPAPAKINGESVGGRKKKIKSRIKRGAGPVANVPGGISTGDDGRVLGSEDTVSHIDDVKSGGQDGSGE